MADILNFDVNFLQINEAYNLCCAYVDWATGDPALPNALKVVNADGTKVAGAAPAPVGTQNVDVVANTIGLATQATLASILSGTIALMGEDYATQATLATLATQATAAAILSNTIGILADTASLDTKTPVLGQAAMTASTPVTMALDQPPLSSGGCEITLYDCSVLPLTIDGATFLLSGNNKRHGVNTIRWTPLAATTGWRKGLGNLDLRPYIGENSEFVVFVSMNVADYAKLNSVQIGLGVNADDEIVFNHAISPLTGNPYSSGMIPIRIPFNIAHSTITSSVGHNLAAVAHLTLRFICSSTPANQVWTDAVRLVKHASVSDGVRNQLPPPTSKIVGGIFESSPGTVTDGHVGPFLMDASKRQVVALDAATDFASQTTLALILADTTAILAKITASAATAANQATANALLATIDADTSNLDVALSTVATEVSLAALLSQTTAILADTGNLDVALSTVATQVTAAAILSNTIGMLVDTSAIAADTGNLDVALSTVATQVTLASVLSQTTAILANVDVALSTVATQTTLAAILSGTIALMGEDYATQATLAAMSVKLPSVIGQNAGADSISVIEASDSAMAANIALLVADIDEIRKSLRPVTGEVDEHYFQSDDVSSLSGTIWNPAANYGVRCRELTVSVDTLCEVYLQWDDVVFWTLYFGANGGTMQVSNIHGLIDDELRVMTSTAAKTSVRAAGWEQDLS